MAALRRLALCVTDYLVLEHLALDRECVQPKVVRRLCGAPIYVVVASERIAVAAVCAVASAGRLHAFAGGCGVLSFGGRGLGVYRVGLAFGLVRRLSRIYLLVLCTNTVWLCGAKRQYAWMRIGK